MSVEVIGIALSEEEASYRPKKYLKTDVQSISCQTAGKIFIGVEVPNDGTLFALQLTVDGNDVEIEQNEKGFGGSTTHDSTAPYKAYAIDLPMRLITAQKRPHTVQFRVGKYEGEEFKVSSISDLFELHVPSETPVIDPKVSPVDSD